MRGHNGGHKNRMFSRSRSRAGAPSRWRPAADNGQPQDRPARLTLSVILVKLWFLATLPFIRLSARRQPSELNETSAGDAPPASVKQAPDLDEAERLARIRRINAAAAKDEAAAAKLKKEATLLPLEQREAELRIGNLELDLALKIIGLGMGIGTLVAAYVIGILDIGQSQEPWLQPWTLWEPPIWLGPR
jgi:hypothetical protein